MLSKRQSFRMTCTTGPMFCGKTSRAINLYEEYKKKGYGVLICCPLFNTRDDGVTLKTHEDVEIEALFFDSSLDILEKIDDDINYIIIDEVQFILNLKDLCFALNIKNVTDVHLFGLYSDFNQKLFQPIADILPFINNRTNFLKSRCSLCGQSKSAEFSKLKNINLENTKTINGHIIGGKDKFEVLCYPCFIVNK